MATERIENTSTLPFRFADGATLRDSESGSGDMRGMADPADATPEIYLDPDDPSLGEYGREWQARRGQTGGGTLPGAWATPPPPTWAAR